jgi:predicted HD superfamily hydrolase involved in NAD metabolism
MKFETFKKRVSELESASIVEMIEELCDEAGEFELYHHMEHVAHVASEISVHYKMNEEQAFLTGFLHDIGKVIDQDEHIEVLKSYGFPVSEEESKVVDVLHSKMSYVITKHVFRIPSEEILNGILYHTTLRSNPTDFEKVMFIADKMTWTYDDLTYNIEETVLQNLNVACFNALKWIIEHLTEKKGLILDDTKEAYLYFKARIIL